QRPQPPPLMPVLRHEVRTLHTQFYRPQNLTNSARLSVTRPALWLADGVVVEQLPAVRDDGLRLARPVGRPRRLALVACPDRLPPDARRLALRVRQVEQDARHLAR